jgi:GNAT superfamily N-acetyltransferase
MEHLDIELLPADSSSDASLIDNLTELVNTVYRTAEEGLWLEGAARTTAADMTALVGAARIALARLDGQIAGCVRLEPVEDGRAELGMLAAAPQVRGVGVGRQLVHFAEERSRDRAADIMQLELLVPQTWAHPSKEFLKSWYLRMGYRIVRKARFDDDYPGLAPLLATPCDLLIFHKYLR